MPFYGYPGPFSNSERRKPPEPHTAANVYEHLNVQFIGKQKLPFTLPPLQWRNNLVALSQKYNYLFVAVRDCIIVYQPQLPDQLVSEAWGNIRVIKSHSATGFSGYINPNCSHGINSLAIGELGHEEVLVSAHDDGDICVYYTGDLSRVALRFSVGASAWGIAMHKQTRRLAVSSNSKLIHVFELAVSKELEECLLRNDRDVESEEHPPVDDDPSQQNGAGVSVLFAPELFAPAGSVNDFSVAIETGNGFYDSQPQAPVRWKCPVKVLKGHTHNVPNVAFLDDASGNWLITTAIDGGTILWDIGAESKVEVTKLPHGERGWSVALLRPEYFLPTRDISECLGMSKGDSCNNRHSKNGKQQYDITPRSKVNLWFPPSSTPRGNFFDMDDEDDDFLEDGDDDGEAELTHAMQDFMQRIGTQDFDWDDQDEDDEEEDGQSWMNHGDTETMDEDSDFDSHEHDDSSNVSATSNALVVISEVEQAVRSHRESVMRFAARLETLKQTMKINQAKKITIPPTFPLSFSEHNARLYFSLNEEPLVHCNLYSRHIPHLEPIDRLNMIHVIPELSTVIAGTQKGKAMIFRLTQTASHGYMMRLDDVLPREECDWDSIRARTPVSTKERDARPDEMLLGIAVGPVQDRQSPTENKKGRDERWRITENRKRYRLMMVYMSGETLTYELGGPGPGEWIMI